MDDYIDEYLDRCVIDIKKKAKEAKEEYYNTVFANTLKGKSQDRIKEEIIDGLTWGIGM